MDPTLYTEAEEPTVHVNTHVNTDGKTSVPMYVIGGIVVVGFFSLLGIMLVRVVPAENVGPVNQLFGTLSMAFGTVIGFFFGSSAGSKRSAEILGEIAKKKL